VIVQEGRQNALVLQARCNNNVQGYSIHRQATKRRRACAVGVIGGSYAVSKKGVCKGEERKTK